MLDAAPQLERRHDRRHARRCEHRLYLGDSIVTSLTDPADTDHRFTVMEYIGRASARRPLLHVHAREDETFYVIEGSIMFHFPREKLLAPAGTAVFLPRGVPHDVVVPRGLARALILLVPGGLEEYFRAVGQPLRAPIFPEKETPGSRPDVETLRAAAESYGVEFQRAW